MDRFAECAFSAIVCDTAYVAIAIATLMFAFSFDPALALKISAGVALAFSLRLIYRAFQLHRKGICHTEIWQVMEPDELPHEASAIRNAQDRTEELLLRFAKAASAASIALCGTSILISLN